MHNTVNSGVYKIQNIVNNKKYIGSSSVLSDRNRQHWNALKRGDHDNDHLQNAWNKYGPDVFVFVVMFFCDNDKLIEYEQYCLDYFKPEYNISPTANSTLGTKRTEEAKERQRQRQTGRTLSQEWKDNIGRGGLGRKMPPRSEQWKYKQRKSQINKKREPFTAEHIENKRIAQYISHEWIKRSIENSKNPNYGVQKSNNKFRASISINGKMKHLGTFITQQEAHAVAVEELFKKIDSYISEWAVAAN